MDMTDKHTLDCDDQGDIDSQGHNCQDIQGNYYTHNHGIRNLTAAQQQTLEQNEGMRAMIQQTKIEDNLPVGCMTRCWEVVGSAGEGSEKVH